LERRTDNSRIVVGRRHPVKNICTGRGASGGNRWQVIVALLRWPGIVIILQ